MSNAAIIEVDFFLLGKLLNLPEGQRVTKAIYSIARDSMLVRVEGEGLPHVADRNEAPMIRPVITEVRRPEIDWSQAHV